MDFILILQKKIFNPEVPDYSTLTLVIIIFGILIKFILGIYVKKKGKEVNSDSLVASGSDAFNDAILSISVLVSAIIYILFKINIEAYVGILLSLFIVKAGIELIKESVDNMLGTRVESSFAKGIKKEVIKEKEVQGAYDLILNDYGPDKYLGSIHIEVADTTNAAEIDELTRKIMEEVYKKHGVILTAIGIYSMNTKDEEVKEIREDISEIVHSYKSVLQMHGFYLNKKEKSISFDIIIDFSDKDKEKIYKEIYEKVSNKYSEYSLNITMDFDVSD